MKNAVLLTSQLTDVYLCELEKHRYPHSPPLPKEGEEGFFDVISETIEAVRSGNVTVLVQNLGFSPTVVNSLGWLASVTDRRILNSDTVRYMIIAEAYIVLLVSDCEETTDIEDVKNAVRDFIGAGGNSNDVLAVVKEVEEEIWHAE